jgi:PIN domain nuclease of toxin-antitoxin system
VRVLLDSHTLIWAVDNPSKLSTLAAATLQDPANELVVSTGTVWEVAIKVGLGKLTLSMPFRDWMTQALGGLGTSLLQITVDHADTHAGLPLHIETRSTDS